MQNTKIFVTGGTGLLGSHLIVALLQRGEHVVALKRESSDTSILKKIAHWYFPNDTINFSLLDWKTGSLDDLESLIDASKECDYVYHCAAIVSFNPKEKEKIIHSNVEGTANMLEAAKLNAVKKFIHVSSIAALGDSGEDQLIDENSPRNPNLKYSGYSLSKFYSELEVWRAHEEGLPVAIINPAIILGPGYWNQSSQKIFSSIDKGMPFSTPGIGAYVDVRDVVSILIHLKEQNIDGERFCLSPHHLKYSSLFTEIAIKLGKKPPRFELKYGLLRFIAFLLQILSYMTGKDPLITKESARSAFSQKQYSSKKIQNQLNYTFIPIEDTIRYCTNAYKEDHLKS